jgi:AmmeMemoRadiSam system protein B
MHADCRHPQPNTNFRSQTNSPEPRPTEIKADRNLVEGAQPNPRLYRLRFSTMSQIPPGQPIPPAPFDPNASHQQRPKLRPVRGFPAKVGEQVLLGLADARQLSDRMVVTSPAVQFVLPLLNGEHTLDEIVQQIGRGLTRPVLESLVAQLDDAALLFGPKYEALLAKVRTDFDASPILPPATTAAFADALVTQELGANATDAQKVELGPTKLRETFDQWIAQTLENVPNPSVDTLPKAIIAPHIDYARGWMNYAAVWGRLRVADRPDRVVILGTNHFGLGTGIVGCDKGYETPFGQCAIDSTLADKLGERLGGIFENRYDHEREHSIELQIPWIQHCLGKDDAGNFCKVFGALVHDPAVNNGESYDGQGVAFMPFVDALRETLSSLPGRTLVVASADLSHVGPMFGDQQALTGDEGPGADFRTKVLNHDREMLELVRLNKPDELVSSLAWQQNPTRWCSTGNIAAALLSTRPADVEMLNYAAAMDQQGAGMVSSCAALVK